MRKYEKEKTLNDSSSHFSGPEVFHTESFPLFAQKHL